MDDISGIEVEKYKNAPSAKTKPINPPKKPTNNEFNR